MNIKYRNISFFMLRFFAYVLIMTGLNYIFEYDATHSENSIKFTENSLTEIFQAIFVFISAVGFFLVGRKDKSLTPLMNLMALIFITSFIREFNNQIDYWFYLALPFLLLFVFLLFTNFKKVIDSFARFIELKSSGIFFIGFLITYVFSRLFGRTSFWKALLEDDYIRTAKNVAEEGIELLGYSIILISVVELVVFVYRKNRTSDL
jgi:hypothetical protein